MTFLTMLERLSTLLTCYIIFTLISDSRRNDLNLIIVITISLQIYTPPKYAIVNATFWLVPSLKCIHLQQQS